ncbi:MAG: DciA family protein [Pseudomonadota bacterium]
MRPPRPRVQPYFDAPRAAPEPPRTRPQVQARARLLGDLAEKTLDPIVKKRGFTNVRLFSHWETVVGPQLAAIAVPEAIKWGRGRDAGGTLVLGCASGDALTLQHQQDIIAERINGFLGWRAIEAVRLKTGRRPPKPSTHRGTAAAPLSPARAARPEARLEDALVRLGTSIDAKAHAKLRGTRGGNTTT